MYLAEQADTLAKAMQQACAPEGWKCYRTELDPHYHMAVCKVALDGEHEGRSVLVIVTEPVERRWHVHIATLNWGSTRADCPGKKFSTIQYAMLSACRLMRENPVELGQRCTDTWRRRVLGLSR